MPEHAIMNPTSTESAMQGAELAFKCPTCPHTLFVSFRQIDPIIGVNMVCPSCKNVAHVPGGYRTWPKPVGLKITSGVQVSISNYIDWFFTHPLVVSLEKSKQLDLLYDYGLWAFCPGCYHQYPATVLAYTFPVLQRTQAAAGHVLISSRPDSARETSALQSGHCPSCGNADIIVILADIPNNIRKVIKKKRKESTK